MPHPRTTKPATTSHPATKIDANLRRVRAICLALPDTSERLSHGEPTFFAGKRVLAMMSTNHHDDGRYAVVFPVEPGLQSIMLAQSPDQFYFPPYVGKAGWIGVHLSGVRNPIGDKELATLIHGAWRLVAPKRAIKAFDETDPIEATPGKPARGRR